MNNIYNYIKESGYNYIYNLIDKDISNYNYLPDKIKFNQKIILYYLNKLQEKINEQKAYNCMCELYSNKN